MTFNFRCARAAVATAAVASHALHTIHQQQLLQFASWNFSVDFDALLLAAVEYIKFASFFGYHFVRLVCARIEKLQQIEKIEQ